MTQPVSPAPWASLASQALTVYRKELRDAGRDHRTLWVVLASSVLLAPALLWALSFWMADLQARNEQRVVWVEGIEQAPSLQNFLARQTYRVQAPPPDAQARLQGGQFHDPVLRIPADFEAVLARGDAPTLTLVTDSSNPRAQAGAQRWDRLLSAFRQERATLALALRGVSPELLEPVRWEEHDLASALSRAASISTVLPFVFIMAVLSGALNAALDTTAGERERGSLEPLLMNPVSGVALALGKWAAVVTVSGGVAVLSCASFLPAQAVFQGEVLRSLVQFGPMQALAFVALLLPLAACVSALLMWVAIHSRSVKEAQASATVLVMLFTALPMLSSLKIIDSQRWAVLVPGLGQQALMGRVLKGEALSAWQWAAPWGVSALVVGLCLWGLSRRWPRTVG
ncbi:MAG: ABC transporter permease subunit [Pseudomonadota bacterium]